MHIFGTLPPDAQSALQTLLTRIAGMEVHRRAPARSSVPHPQSTDLELAIQPHLESLDFQHHVRLHHPRTGEGFEYDFFRARDGIALEVMGYRADDEVYKDILKFHVHPETRIGVVLVPRYKWISSRRTDTNYAATLKALAFADHSMNVEALVAVAYDWEAGEVERAWGLVVVG
ncbi:hypothetical protein [Lujinxingia vulgaris]|uniref:hypothetical protein n=1 Tax=Lujinxingia vulgaris TaxID=2600176 RepID=UPI001E5A8009|nr:hypothetical protein [Lujinxingia vulgaris]